MTLPIDFANAGIPSNLQALGEALGQASVSTDSGFNGRELLRLSKDDGAWSFGQEQLELEEGAEIAVNPLSFMHGFISWQTKKGEVLGERMVPVTQALPEQAELPNTGEKWDEQLMVEMQILNGEDEGVPLVYKTTAHGGKSLIRAIMRAVTGQIGAGSEYIVPVINLTSSSYQHKVYNTVYKPEFELVAWINMQGEVQTSKKAIAKPTAKSTAKKAAVQEPEEEEIEEEVEVKEVKEAAKAPAKRTRRASAAKEEETKEEPAEEAEEKPQPRRRRRRA